MARLGASYEDGLNLMVKIENRHKLYWLQPNENGIWHVGTAEQGMNIKSICGKKFRRYSFICMSYTMEKGTTSPDHRRCKRCTEILADITEKEGLVL